jgi:hypothetical protein
VRPIGLIGRSEQFEDQRATVKLSHFTSGQNRYLFLRCLVQDETPEVAKVKISYADEIAGGEQSASGAVRINFTEDKSAAAKSVNGAVVAEKELFLTAVRKDEALSAADGGNYREAAQKLKDQADVLDKNYANAPASVQIQIRGESKNLRDRSKQLEEGQYDSSFRKTMQNESFTTRNSK